MSTITDLWDSYTFYFNSGLKGVGEATDSATQSTVNFATTTLPTTVNELATSYSNAIETAWNFTTTPFKTVYNDAKSAVSGANQTFQLVIVAGVVVAAIFLLSKSGRRIIGQTARNTGKMTDAGLKVVGKVI